MRGEAMETSCSLRACGTHRVMRSRRQPVIARGTYANADGKLGTLRVERNFIEFNGDFDPRWKSNGTSGQYEYRLYKDGGVILYGSSNSTYFLEVACCWTWDGKAFEFSPDHKGIEKTIFTRVDAR